MRNTISRLVRALYFDTPPPGFLAELSRIGDRIPSSPLCVSAGECSSEPPRCRYARFAWGKPPPTSPTLNPLNAAPYGLRRDGMASCLCCTVLPDLQPYVNEVIAGVEDWRVLFLHINHPVLSRLSSIHGCSEALARLTRLTLLRKQRPPWHQMRHDSLCGRGTDGTGRGPIFSRRLAFSP